MLSLWGMEGVEGGDGGILDDLSSIHLVIVVGPEEFSTKSKTIIMYLLILFF